MITNKVNIRWLGQQDYMNCWQKMQQFTHTRTNETLDELWLLEHGPVYTQGQNGKPEHVLHPGTVPVVQTDRGGQVTYHGPGQLMIYTLVDLKRKQFTIRSLVSLLEQSVIDFLAAYNITAYAKPEAPGVYVDKKKIGSIGLRVRRGCAYHGVAFNVAMDLQAFTHINPCGFAKLEMTQFVDLGGLHNTLDTARELIHYFMKHLGYTSGNYYWA
ncbi:MAG: lipoyl(octanoyl) transferase LipB [Gammaproteobacteria bacterium]|nr:lipoyl(octanoyl) transferase LipB [Gammaproteobacteria bacterium]